MSQLHPLPSGDPDQEPWFYYRRGSRGPATRREIQNAIDLGRLPADLWVRRSESHPWMPASEFGFRVPQPVRKLSYRSYRSSQPAGLVTRLVAAGIDGVALGFVAVIIGWAGDIAVQAVMGPGFYGKFDPVILLSLFSFVLYFAILEGSSLRGSLGKALMGLEVRESGGGQTIFGRAFFRTLCKGLSFAPLGAGVLIAPFHPNRQTLHDIIAGTEVVRPVQRGHHQARAKR